MNIAIIGAGNVGGTLGRIWAQRGHSVVFGVRDPFGEKIRLLLDVLPVPAKADSVAAAAGQSDPRDWSCGINPGRRARNVRLQRADPCGWRGILCADGGLCRGELGGERQTPVR